VTEYRALLTGACLLCGLGCASGAFRVVERITTLAFTALLVLGSLAVAGYLGQELIRDLRFRAEMRTLDRRDNACAAARLRVGAPR
jgi:hypothetical protein